MSIQGDVLKRKYKKHKIILFSLLKWLFKFFNSTANPLPTKSDNDHCPLHLHEFPPF